MKPVTDNAPLRDASRIHMDAQDETALAEALHAAENEGWKPLSPYIVMHKDSPLRSCTFDYST